VKEKLINKARSMGYEVYRNSSEQQIIRARTEETEILLKENKSSDKWLLISNQVPQAWLTTERALGVLKRIKSRPFWQKSYSKQLKRIKIGTLIYPKNLKS